jgi:hypothetical protein
VPFLLQAPSHAVQFALDVTHTAQSSAQRRTHGTSSMKLLQNAYTKHSGPKMVNRSVQHGSEKKDAPCLSTMPTTSAQDVEWRSMEPRDALVRRRLQPLTTYKAEAWEHELQQARITERFAKIPRGLLLGFEIDFPPITVVQTPPNRPSISEFPDEFNSIIQKELDKGRFIGPFLEDELINLIGPFQSSPLSIIPKPGSLKFRIVQNFSFPHSPNSSFPNPSVNSLIDANNFPTTWGKFSIIYLLISRLPPKSEVATRDVSEAYRTVPLHPSQWPAAVVRVSESQFCVDTCTAFGATPSAGAYGHIADAGTEIFRFHGMGPLDKWVDDHIFFRIRHEYLADYNNLRRSWHQALSETGMKQAGSRLSFELESSVGGQIEEFNEDCHHPLKDLSRNSLRSSHDQLFTSSIQDIDAISAKLGIVWAIAKDQPFHSSTVYIGFVWDLERMVVSLSGPKADKYLAAIHKWRKRHVHTLQDVQELYGKLLHASSAAPQGRAYLTSLEEMLSTCSTKPFLPHRAGKSVAQDLEWWSSLLQSGGVSRPIYPPLPPQDPLAFSDASSGIGIGIVIGDFWRAWRLIPGWKTHNGIRDIGWAEAIGFELLIYTLATLPGSSGTILTHRDNTGIIEGWRKSRHRNWAVNGVFKRIHEFILNLPYRFEIHTTYIPSASNPADGPSRGIYGPLNRLLPPIPIPEPIREFIIDATAPLSPTELRHLRDGNYTPPATKFINSIASTERAASHSREQQAEEDQFISQSLRDD